MWCGYISIYEKIILVGRLSREMEVGRLRGGWWIVLGERWGGLSWVVVRGWREVFGIGRSFKDLMMDV